MTALCGDPTLPAVADSAGDIRCVLIGEIHTGVLQNLEPLTTETSTELLALGSDQQVRSWERPVRHAASPEILTGVDCDLPSASGTRRRAIGTVAAEARVTAGRVLQTAARSRLIPVAGRRRLIWSHYLTKPAAVEVLGELPMSDVIDGYLRSAPTGRTLNLGGVCAGLFAQVQSSPALNRGAPFRAARTSFQWAASAATAGQSSSIRLTIAPAGRRTLEIVAAPAVLPYLADLCQDVALHDWLLSSVIDLLDVAVSGRERVDVVRQLRPAVDNLLHAWMPAARLPPDLVPFWDEIERRSGFSRQWETAVNRIRDQIALAVLEQGTARPKESINLRTTPDLAPAASTATASTSTGPSGTDVASR